MKYLKYISWLSIDVAFGAMVMLQFIANTMNLNIGWAPTVCLGIAVWIIYLVDHILDIRGAYRVISNRRKFHRSIIKPLQVWVVMLAAAGTICVFQLNRSVIMGGVSLMVLGLFYFLLVRKGYLVKEPIVAMVYTSGILLVPSTISGHLPSWFWFIGPLLFLLAFSNLILFSYFDREMDNAEGHPSGIAMLTTENLRWLVAGVVLAYAGCLAILSRSQAPVSLTIYFSMGALILGLMTVFSTWFKKNEAFRFVGDAIFWMPVFII